MPLSTGHRNKQKVWRKEARVINAGVGSKHNGRRAKMTGNPYMGSGPVASEILIGMFERAGIKMPRAEAFREAFNNMRIQKQMDEELKAFQQEVTS